MVIFQLFMTTLARNRRPIQPKLRENLFCGPPKRTWEIRRKIREKTKLSSQQCVDLCELARFIEHQQIPHKYCKYFTFASFFSQTKKLFDSK